MQLPALGLQPPVTDQARKKLFDVRRLQIPPHTHASHSITSSNNYDYYNKKHLYVKECVERHQTREVEFVRIIGSKMSGIQRRNKKVEQAGR